MNDFNKAINTLDLWIKVKSGESLTLIDVPELIPLRWEYIKQNWKQIKQDLINKASSYQGKTPDEQGIRNSIIQQIDEMDNLINLRPKKEATRT